MQLSRSKPVFTFDVGGVLIIWRNNNPIFRYIAKRYGIPFSKARIVMSKVLPRFENGRINYSQFLKRSLAHFGRKLNQGDSPAR